MSGRTVSPPLGWSVSVLSKNELLEGSCREKQELAPAVIEPPNPAKVPKEAKYAIGRKYVRKCIKRAVLPIQRRFIAAGVRISIRESDREHDLRFAYARDCWCTR